MTTWTGTAENYSSAEDSHLAELLRQDAAEQSDWQGIFHGFMNGYLIVGVLLMILGVAMHWHGAVLMFGVLWVLDLVGQPWKAGR